MRRLPGFHVGKVSIHAFRGEGDNGDHSAKCQQWSFNPRLPGGRRPEHLLDRVLLLGFNPRLPGGRRHAGHVVRSPLSIVSIHAFRGEGDVVRRADLADRDSFNPRLPGGRRLVGTRPDVPGMRRFNPRLPGGRRQRTGSMLSPDVRFNPRLPGGRRPPPPPR